MTSYPCDKCKHSDICEEIGECLIDTPFHKNKINESKR